MLVISFEKDEKKVSRSQEKSVQFQSSRVSSSDYDAVCVVDESLSLSVTLFRDASSGAFQDKFAKLEVFQRRSGIQGLKKNWKDSNKSLGVCSIPLHSFADSVLHNVVLPLQWSLADGSTIHATIIGNSRDNDAEDDRSSIASSRASFSILNGQRHVPQSPTPSNISQNNFNTPLSETNESDAIPTFDPPLPPAPLANNNASLSSLHVQIQSNASVNTPSQMLRQRLSRINSVDSHNSGLRSVPEDSETDDRTKRPSSLDMRAPLPVNQSAEQVSELQQRVADLESELLQASQRIEELTIKYKQSMDSITLELHQTQVKLHISENASKAVVKKHQQDMQELTTKLKQKTFLLETMTSDKLKLEQELEFEVREQQRKSEVNNEVEFAMSQYLLTQNDSDNTPYEDEISNLQRQLDSKDQEMSKLADMLCRTSQHVDSLVKQLQILRKRPQQ